MAPQAGAPLAPHPPPMRKAPTITRRKRDLLSTTHRTGRASRRYEIGAAERQAAASAAA